MFIDEELDFIKSQIAHHERSVEHFHSRRDHQKANRHSGILRRFQEILPKMQEIQEHGLAKSIFPNADSEKVGSRFGDLSDLPEELRNQLVSVQFDAVEQSIIEIVRDNFGGVASIDEILVGLFRATGELHQREGLANKIYRMTRKELLFSVQGRKGVYSIVGFEESENGSSDSSEASFANDP